MCVSHDVYLHHWLWILIGVYHIAFQLFSQDVIFWVAKISNFLQFFSAPLSPGQLIYPGQILNSFHEDPAKEKAIIRFNIQTPVIICC